MAFYANYAVGDIVKANHFCGIVLEVAREAKHYDDFFDSTHWVSLRSPLFRIRFLTERQHRWVTLDTQQVWFYDDQLEYWLFPDEINPVCGVGDANYTTLLHFLGLEETASRLAA